MLKIKTIVLTIPLFWLPFGASFSGNVILDNRNVLYLSIPMSLSPSEISFRGRSLGAIDLENGGIDFYFKFEENSSPSNVSISSISQYNISLSSGSRYVAFIKVKSLNRATSIKTTFIIIDMEKKESIIVGDDIYSYVWNPRREILAYIKGVDHEGFPGFLSRGVFIYDPVKKNAKTIDFIAYDIAWNGSGQALYMTDFRSVACFDIKNQKLEKTERKGIYFSPDNKYYFCKNYEGNPSILYGSSDDKPIEPINEKLRQLDESYNFEKWLGKKTILVDVGDDKYVVINIETNSIISEFQGSYVGSNRSGSKIVIHPLKGKSIDFNSYRIISLPEAQ